MGDNILNLDDLDVGGKPPFEFQFDGETYRCASPEVLDIRGLSDLQEQANSDPIQLLSWMLGPEQMEKLDASPAIFSVLHLDAVMNGWYNHHGINPGKSGGSSKSPGTRMPAKR